MIDWIGDFGREFVLVLGVFTLFMGWIALMAVVVFAMIRKIERARWAHAVVYGVILSAVWIAGGLILGGW